jgi:hypothetical protein
MEFRFTGEKEKLISGMRWRNNQPLLISLIVLVLAGIGLGLTITKPWLRAKKSTSFFGDQIDRFCVNDTCLQKGSDKWFIGVGTELIPADNEIVTNYVGKFENIQFGDIISANPDNFADLGIGISQLVISANGKSLEVGKINSNYDGTYVREANAETVYNIGLILEKNNIGNPKSWINKTITNLAILQTQKVIIEKNGKSIDFIPKNGNWDDPKWVEKVDYLTAVDYLDRFIPGNENQTMLTVETDSKQTTITLGMKITDKKEPIFWVTTDGKYYYSIGADDYNLLTGKIK